MAQSNSSAKKKSSSGGKAPAKSKSGTAAKQAPTEAPQPIRRELWAIVFLLLSVFSAISYFRTEGSFIIFFSTYIKGLIGWGYWIVSPTFFLLSMILFFHKGRPVTFRVISALLLPILFAAIVHLINLEPIENFQLKPVIGILFEQGQSLRSGGVVGGLIAIGLELAFSIYGAMPVLIISFLFFFVKALKIDMGQVITKVQEQTAVKYDPAKYDIPLVQGEKQSNLSAQTKTKTTTIQRITQDRYGADIPLGEDEDSIPLFGSTKYTDTGYTAETPVKTKVRKRADAGTSPTAGVKPLTAEEAARLAGVDISTIKTQNDVPKKIASTAEISDPPKVKRLSRGELEVQTRAVAAEISANTEQGDYQFPQPELLFSGDNAPVDGRGELLTYKERLEGALHSFGINAVIVGVIRGPTVTRFDLELDQGVKLKKVTELANDLALALGVVNVRIAPIPGKVSTVGVEVPNKIVSTVHLRTVIESPKFINAQSKLTFALGKDISGECVIGNISKLPHMLIAGTTGSGKSVCMNALILSILFKAKPEEVRFIMIDPKMVELGVYNSIPHLFVPVVTDPKKAAGALQWAVVEMLKRYRLFSEVSVRELSAYNERCKKEEEETLPQVVIVIDELADLMLAASKEVEESICRLAQMGRAAGMHLVIATQRPSADVITGLMKANIPSRIAFAVSSAMESRIILDQVGAEKLVGMGDMLFSPVGTGKPLRIQGAYVSDEERENVIQFIREGSSPAPMNSEIEEFMVKATQDKNSSDSGKAVKDDGPASDYDELVGQAAEVAIEMKSCSVTMLQRRLKLGYSRAARIMDQLEQLGVVGPYEGAKPRKTVIDRNGWQELQYKLGLADDDMSNAAAMSESNEDDYKFDD